MNPEEIKNKYGAEFHSDTLTKKYGATFTPVSQSAPVQPIKPELPILTKESGGFGTALKDVTVGAGKGFLRGARGVAGLLQAGGQRIMAAIDPTKTYEQTRATTGFKSLQEETPEGAGVTEVLEPKSRGEQVGGALETAAEFATGFAVAKGPQAIAKAKQAYDVSKKAKEAEKVTEMIRPKPTMKQAQLAQKEGRFVEGKEPTFFRKGTEDKIIPSEKTLSARDVIMQKIPNASKMKPGELYKAVQGEITKTAENLRPQMKATPVKPETIQKINTDWEALKKAQVQAADATEEANVIKLQNQFEERLRKSGSGSHDDLWETAIDYDKSIPENVKKANSLSPESLQNKKDIWLQNRAVLRDAINDNTAGMGDISRKSFREMSDLYEAQHGILSQTKVNKEQASKLKQLIKKHPEVAGVLKVALGVEAFRRITGADLLP